MPFKDPNKLREWTQRHRADPKVKARIAANRASNPNIAASVRASYSKNKDKILAKKREDRKAWRLANPEAARVLSVEEGRRWRKISPDKVRDYRRLWHYGVSPEQYDTMLADRGPNCPLCEREAAPVIDHCHETGFVRGLPCGKCNTAIGMVKDDPSTLRRMADYLDQAAKARLFS